MPLLNGSSLHLYRPKTSSTNLQQSLTQVSTSVIIQLGRHFSAWTIPHTRASGPCSLGNVTFPHAPLHQPSSILRQLFNCTNNSTFLSLFYAFHTWRAPSSLFSDILLTSFPPHAWSPRSCVWQLNNARSLCSFLWSPALAILAHANTPSLLPLPILLMLLAPFSQVPNAICTTAVLPTLEFDSSVLRPNRLQPLLTPIFSLFCLLSIENQKTLYKTRKYNLDLRSPKTIENYKTPHLDTDFSGVGFFSICHGLGYPLSSLLAWCTITVYGVLPGPPLLPLPPSYLAVPPGPILLSASLLASSLSSSSPHPTLLSLPPRYPLP